jgi:hypothetical protein
MDLRLSKQVEEVVLIFRDDNDRRVSRTVFRRGKKSKKGAAPLNSIGRLVRKVVSGQETVAKDYLERHDASNRDKPDGWLRDLSYNVYRATRRGVRKVSRNVGLPSIDVD